MLRQFARAYSTKILPRSTDVVVIGEKNWLKNFEFDYKMIVNQAVE